MRKFGDGIIESLDRNFVTVIKYIYLGQMLLNSALIMLTIFPASFVVGVAFLFVVFFSHFHLLQNHETVISITPDTNIFR